MNLFLLLRRHGSDYARSSPFRNVDTSQCEQERCSHIRNHLEAEELLEQERVEVSLPKALKSFLHVQLIQ